jgi:hypothetical protein
MKEEDNKLLEYKSKIRSYRIQYDPRYKDHPYYIYRKELFRWKLHIFEDENGNVEQGYDKVQRAIKRIKREMAKDNIDDPKWVTEYEAVRDSL